MERSCQLEGCGGKVKARGWCNRHWLRWRKYGNPLTVRQNQLHGLSDEERFGRRIAETDDPSDCWEWTGARTAAGYGRFTIHPEGKTVHQYAHRRVYEDVFGPIPDGWEVCHECDNPPCCNPAHLFIGTHADNMRDMADKGRNPGNGHIHGVKHHNAKLNPEKVLDIRARHTTGTTGRALAKEYGVTESTISRVILRKGWRQVAG